MFTLLTYPYERLNLNPPLPSLYITFTNNLPTNTQEISQIVNQLRGLVSDETLLSQIPFVDDAEEELKKAQAEKQENMKLYDFGSSNSEDGADNELLGKENNTVD